MYSKAQIVKTSWYWEQNKQRDQQKEQSPKLDPSINKNLMYARNR